MSQVPDQLLSAMNKPPDKRPFSYLPSGGLSELQQRQSEHRMPGSHASPFKPLAVHAALGAPVTRPADSQPLSPPQQQSSLRLISPPPQPPWANAYGVDSSALSPPTNWPAPGNQSYYGTQPWISEHGQSQTSYRDSPLSSLPTSGYQSPVVRETSTYHLQQSPRDGVMSPKFGPPTFGWSPTHPSQMPTPGANDVVAYVLQPDGTMAAIRCPNMEQATLLAAIQEDKSVRRSEGMPWRQLSTGSSSSKSPGGTAGKSHGLAYKVLQVLTSPDGSPRCDLSPGTSNGSVADSSEDVQRSFSPSPFGSDFQQNSTVEVSSMASARIGNNYSPTSEYVKSTASDNTFDPKKRTITILSSCNGHKSTTMQPQSSVQQFTDF